MEISTLRKKLHSLIDSSSEEKLKEVYNLLEEGEYTDEFKTQLDEEQAAYQKNGEVISKEEIDKLVEQLLRGKSK
jgi:DNA-dependent RNA polymerase auxiliary subunit epsilon